ncbi:hypothetical protein [Sporosarcina aquimarina]|uniref:Uncharacterized protein n=1 Tax=Sporosarcina aquimarina TaxID=114975 RepID=A0ABU4FZY4_9BACL|nr:hypothetical protein [Sporosarcina aquimarina]MDW0110278.1 hypothetical protein [Sporosarcina aquimarina]
MSQDILATLTYTVSQKTVGWIDQTISTNDCQLTLHETVIHSQHYSFPIDAVLDCSYKPFSDGSGLFYLHTNQGVRSFHVNMDPSFFLKAYQRLKGDLYL